MTDALTRADVLALLDYDPETGVFRWRETCGRRKTVAGQIAGTVKKSTGYRVMKFRQKPYRANRLAWLIVTGAWPTHQVDHRNGVRSDDRWSNLRAATPSQNRANGRRRSDNASGFKGVRKTASGRWNATIQCVATKRRLGTFDTPEEAHAAYLAAAREVFGDFARSE